MNAPLRTYRPPAAGTQNHRSSATTRVAPFAHLHIGSFANSTYNSSPITHNSSHSFSAKERDAETGLSYFGSRYYSSDLSVWLSVDPMSGKYPSFSPYVYCADNPVRCVDPKGETVVIVGESAEEGFDRMQQGTNLNLSINDNGVVSIIGGKIKNDNDQLLSDAINEKNVVAKIIASAKMPDVDNDGETTNTQTGHCYGAQYDEATNTSVATNYVNVQGINEYELPGAEGAGMIHEVTEAYLMGKRSLSTKQNISPATRQVFQLSNGMTHTEYGQDYWTYMECHRNATKAPNEMTKAQSSEYRSASPQYWPPLPLKLSGCFYK